MNESKSFVTKLSFVFFSFSGGSDEESKAASPEAGSNSSTSTKPDDVAVDDAKGAAGDVFTDDPSTKTVKLDKRASLHKGTSSVATLLLVD